MSASAGAETTMSQVAGAGPMLPGVRPYAGGHTGPQGLLRNRCCIPRTSVARRH